jgi:S-adenosylmethionine:tRNA ribosyltransferase-isomerase
LSFEVPRDLEAVQPPEARGLTRDAVRMMVGYRSTNTLVHSAFSSLPTFVEPGDLVVVNTSGTIPAAVDAHAVDGTRIVIHLSTRIEGERWVVEPRRALGKSSQRWSGEHPPRTMSLVGEASVELLEPYRGSDRLWIARIEFPQPALAWLAGHGRPIHYGYLDRRWPVASYQTVYSTEPGSAEMPSAGRPFTPEVITRLVAKGAAVTPVVLHTGVSSLEADEVPYPERVTVPRWTAARVNATRREGGRVIAVGTTVVRALESAADDDGKVEPLHGWTDVVITPERGIRVVDGMLTGWHEPEASHLLMLEAIAGRELLEHSYATGLAAGYLWHEFGDVHLILP